MGSDFRRCIWNVSNNYLKFGWPVAETELVIAEKKPCLSDDVALVRFFYLLLLSISFSY